MGSRKPEMEQLIETDECLCVFSKSALIISQHFRHLTSDSCVWSLPSQLFVHSVCTSSHFLPLRRTSAPTLPAAGAAERCSHLENSAADEPAAAVAPDPKLSVVVRLAVRNPVPAGENTQTQHGVTLDPGSLELFFYYSAQKTVF